MEEYDDRQQEGELRQKNPSNSEFQIKSEILEPDDRTGSSFIYKQIKDQNGRYQEQAIYNGNKEFITRGLKIGNIKYQSYAHQWVIVRLKHIRTIQFIEEEENLDLTSLTSYYVDGLHANLGMSLSLEMEGFKRLTSNTQSHDIKERRVSSSSTKGELRTNPMRDEMD